MIFARCACPVANSPIEFVALVDGQTFVVPVNDEAALQILAKLAKFLAERQARPLPPVEPIFP